MIRNSGRSWVASALGFALMVLAALLVLQVALQLLFQLLPALLIAGGLGLALVLVARRYLYVDRW